MQVVTPERIRTVVIQVYIGLVLFCGAVAAGYSVNGLHIDEPLKFCFFFALAVLSAVMKVKLPGITGSLSVTYVVILIGLSDLTLAESMIAGLAAVVIQTLVGAKSKPKPIQAAFNVANVAIAIIAADAVLRSPWLRSGGLGLPLRLTLASITYFLANTMAVTGIISLTEKKSFPYIWKECYLWSFPFFFVGAGVAWVFHTLSARYGWQMGVLTVPAVYILYTAYSFYHTRLQRETTHAVEMAALHLRTIEALALAIDAKDQTTHDHLRRVQTYASALAQDLKLSPLEIEGLQAAAVLHDIGKLAVPEHIISKPGRLTPEEFEKMKIHPIVGAQILERVQFPYPVVPIVRAHHEKWDGTGYPDGLSGEAIPIGARILAAVDCLDALASDRQYRKGIGIEAAMEEVKRMAGTAFDPKVVELLAIRCRELEEASHAAPIRETLDTDVSVERGQEPDAGFEQTANSSENDKAGFLSSISAARREMQTLFELTGDLGNSLRLDDMLAMFATKLKTLIPHDLLCIYSVRDRVLHPDYAGGAETALFGSLRIPVGEGVSGWVAGHNSPIVNGNPAVEPGYLNDPTVITNLKSALSMPIEEDGVAVGAITLYAQAANAFHRDHLRILSALLPRLQSAIANGKRLTSAQDSAVTDFLTGLPNSRSLYLHLDEELASAARLNRPLGVLFCDLDGFKRINDVIGHAAGDKALKAVATALKSVCRGGDYVARMGGDEFVILLPGADEATIAARVPEFHTAVEAAAAELGFTGLSVSIGASNPDLTAESLDSEAVLAEADKRMYTFKRRRKAERTGESIKSLAESVRSPKIVPIASPAHFENDAAPVKAGVA